MSKRSFRTPSARADQPAYPTLERFDQSRRDALRRLGALGAAVLGAGGLLAACTRDNILPQTDGGPPPGLDGLATQGKMVPVDARIDQQQVTPDQRRPRPDQRMPDAYVLEGDVAGPDARVDEPDQGSSLGGVARMPDSGR